MSVVDRFQLHAVVVGHTVRGDDSSTAVNQLEGGFFAIHCLVLVYRHCAAVQCHCVVFPDLLQIREIRDNRCLLTTVRQVNKVLDFGQPQLVSHSLELTDLAGAEAVQPFRQVVQLIDIDQRTHQGVQHAVPAVHFIHSAVPVDGKAQVNCLEHLNGLIVLVNGNGKGDSDLIAFRTSGVAQNRLDHITHTPPPSSKPSFISHSRCLGLVGRLQGSFFWGLFFRVSMRVDGDLDGSIIIRSNPARRVSPMKYRAIFFLSSSFLICAVPEKRTK